METIRSSETSVNVYRIEQLHIPNDGTLHIWAKYRRFEYCDLTPESRNSGASVDVHY
jgi:hypothetical protein